MQEYSYATLPKCFLPPQLFHDIAPEDWSHIISKLFSCWWRRTLGLNSQILDDSWAWVTKYIVGNTDSTFILADTSLESKQPYITSSVFGGHLKGNLVTHFSVCTYIPCITAWRCKENRARLLRKYKMQVSPFYLFYPYWLLVVELWKYILERRFLLDVEWYLSAYLCHQVLTIRCMALP